MNRSDWLRALALALLCLAVYLVKSSYRIVSIDEISIFTTARSLAMRASPDVDLLGFQYTPTWEGAQLHPGSGAGSGHFYSHKEPGTAFLLAPWLRLAALFGLNGLQFSALLMPLVTALTVALLVGLARHLGASPRAAGLAGLALGLASLSMFYSTTLFTQPLIALGLLAALAGTIRARETGRLGPAIWAGVGAGLAGLGGVVTLALGPLYALWAIPWQEVRERGLLRAALGAWRAWLGLLIGVLPFIALLLGYNAYRFGDPFELGHNLSNQVFGPGVPLFSLSYLPVGLFGLTLSAPRGLLWYAPFVLLVPWGVILGLRDRARVTGLALAQAVILLGVYASYYYWGGGFFWGPRFLVAVMPALVLVCLPVFERALAPGAGWRRWLVFGVLALSAAIQVYASLSFDGAYEVRRDAASTAVVTWLPDQFSWELTPLAEMLSAPGERAWNPAWLAAGHLDLPALAAGLAAIGLGLGLLWWVRRDRVGVSAWLPLAGYAVAVGALGLWYAERYPPFPPDQDRGISALAAQVAAGVHPDQAIIAMLPYTYTNWLGVSDGRLYELGLPYEPEPGPVSLQMLENLQGRWERAWLITGGMVDADPDNGVERWLADHAYVGPVTWFEDHYRLRPLAFERDEMALQPLDVALGPRGELALVGAAHYEGAGYIAVWLRWQANAAVSMDYSVALHLLDSSGAVAVQFDGQPVLGYCPTTTWSAGEQIDDRRLIVLPDDLPPGRYRLTAALYNWMDNTRLPRTDGGGDVIELAVLQLGQR